MEKQLRMIRLYSVMCAIFFTPITRLGISLFLHFNVVSAVEIPMRWLRVCRHQISRCVCHINSLSQLDNKFQIIYNNFAEKKLQIQIYQTLKNVSYVLALIECVHPNISISAFLLFFPQQAPWNNPSHYFAGVTASGSICHICLMINLYTLFYAKCAAIIFSHLSDICWTEIFSHAIIFIRMRYY